jgi:hypothetical protein
MCNYCRHKNFSGTRPLVGQQYIRQNLIQNLAFPVDFHGVTHYWDDARRELYTFYAEGHTNRWNPTTRIFDYDSQNLDGDKNTQGYQRYLFYRYNGLHVPNYEYLGPVKSERMNGNHVTWQL